MTLFKGTAGLAYAALEAVETVKTDRNKRATTTEPVGEM
jgi:hypothetical protein